jgi:hypothetical protein
VSAFTGREKNGLSHRGLRGGVIAAEERDTEEREQTQHWQDRASLRHLRLHTVDRKGS